MKRLALALLALELSACSTHYTPQRGPRLSIVMEGGSPAYERDGRRYPHGFAGSGLVEAVSDDPEAREAAETYESRMTSGFVLSVLGAACAVGGIVLLSPREDRTDTQTTVGLGALACAVGTTIAGSVVLISAQPYQYDAINIYNDHAERRRFPPAPVYYAPPPPPGRP
ncbi:MAG: hypothetical protein KC776_24960 [Myxococcales bacterium]|nr:hypothetical protein [Myxococcales bacterium]MCB9579706.1 hypothetical protein [Polyangiaceae bacterium]